MDDAWRGQLLDEVAALIWERTSLKAHRDVGRNLPTVLRWCVGQDAVELGIHREPAHCFFINSGKGAEVISAGPFKPADTPGAVEEAADEVLKRLKRLVEFPHVYGVKRPVTVDSYNRFVERVNAGWDDDDDLSEPVSITLVMEEGTFNESLVPPSDIAL